MKGFINKKLTINFPRIKSNITEYKEASDPPMNVLQFIVSVLDKNVIKFFEAKHYGTGVNTVNEPFLEKVRLWKNQTNYKITSIRKIRDNTYANRWLKGAL